MERANDPVASYSRTRALIDKYGFTMKKSFGQNFLVDNHVVEKIIKGANIGPKDLVIEIGPGFGGLTQGMAAAAGHLVAIELDTHLLPVLQETLADYPNVDIINQDVLKVDFKALLASYTYERAIVVGNLPYYITTPIVMGILEQKLPIGALVVMVQKEVAARMLAKPGTKDCGALSLAIQYYCQPSLLANVPQNCFIPRPQVDSAVVRMDVLEQPPIDVDDERLLFALIKCAFAMRRKTMLNCLCKCEGVTLNKEEAAEILAASGLSPQARGETLTLADYAALTQATQHFMNQR